MFAFLILLLLPVALFGVRITRDPEGAAADVTRDWHHFHPFGATPEALVLRTPALGFHGFGRNKG